MQADAFNMAYMLTGNFFIIFGCVGGPFYSSVIANLPKISEGGNKTWIFIKDILVKTTVALVLISIALYIFKSTLLQFFINQEANPDYFNLTLINIDILIPLVLICGPIGIVYAVLNCYKKYAEPSFSPAIVNIVSIATVFIMGDSLNGLAMAIGTSLGGIASLLTQFRTLDQIKTTLKNKINEISFDLKEQKQNYHKILMPTLLATGASQLMVFVDGHFCAELEPGSWTALVLSNRLIQMPLGILLTAFLVPTFPRITKLIAEKNFSDVKKVLSKSIGILVLLCIPATLVGLFFSEPLIKLVFEHGAFDARSTQMVSSTFYYLCFSIIPYVLRDCFTRTLYSLGEAKFAFYLTLSSVIIKYGLNYLLVKNFGLNGLAISTTLITIINASIMFVILIKTWRHALNTQSSL